MMDLLFEDRMVNKYKYTDLYPLWSLVS
jgi:hypothetical protein